MGKMGQSKYVSCLWRIIPTSEISWRSCWAASRDIKLVAQAGSLAEACNHAVRFDFDVAVPDLGLPDGDGVDLIADLRQANPDVGVLILSASLDAASFERATEADEIMDKLAPLDEVLGTLRRLGNA